MNYRLTTEKPFDKTIEDLQKRTSENGFRVLHIHDVKQTLKEKGFEVDNYCIVEVCNAKFANNVLGINKEFGVMMPCKINVYSDCGKTVLTMPEPSKMVKMLGMEALENVAKEVDVILKKVMDETV